MVQEIWSSTTSKSLCFQSRLEEIVDTPQYPVIPPRIFNKSWSSNGVASHAGIFRDEKRAPLPRLRGRLQMRLWCGNLCKGWYKEPMNLLSSSWPELGVAGQREPRNLVSRVPGYALTRRRGYEAQTSLLLMQASFLFSCRWCWTVSHF